MLASSDYNYFINAFFDRPDFAENPGFIIDENFNPDQWTTLDTPNKHALSTQQQQLLDAANLIKFARVNLNAEQLNRFAEFPKAKNKAFYDAVLSNKYLVSFDDLNKDLLVQLAENANKDDQLKKILNSNNVSAAAIDRILKKDKISPAIIGKISEIFEDESKKQYISDKLSADSLIKLVKLAKTKFTYDELNKIAKFSKAKNDKAFYGAILSNPRLTSFDDFDEDLLANLAKNTNKNDQLEKILDSNKIGAKPIDEILQKSKIDSSIVLKIFEKIEENSNKIANDLSEKSLIRLAGESKTKEQFATILALSKTQDSTNKKNRKIAEAILANKNFNVEADDVTVDSKLILIPYISNSKQLTRIANKLDDSSGDSVKLAEAIIENDRLLTANPNIAKIILAKGNIVKDLPEKSLQKLVKFATTQQEFKNILGAGSINAKIVDQVITQANSQKLKGIRGFFRRVASIFRKKTPNPDVENIVPDVFSLNEPDKTTGKKKVSLGDLSLQSLKHLQKCMTNSDRNVSYDDNLKVVSQEINSWLLKAPPEKKAASSTAPGPALVSVDEVASPSPPIPAAKVLPITAVPPTPVPPPKATTAGTFKVIGKSDAALTPLVKSLEIWWNAANADTTTKAIGATPQARQAIMRVESDGSLTFHGTDVGKQADAFVAALKHMSEDKDVKKPLELKATGFDKKVVEIILNKLETSGIKGVKLDFPDFKVGVDDGLIDKSAKINDVMMGVKPTPTADPPPPPPTILTADDLVASFKTDNHEASEGAISYNGTGGSLLSEISGATAKEALDAAEVKAKAAIAKFVSEKDSSGSIGLEGKLNALVDEEKAKANIVPLPSPPPPPTIPTADDLVASFKTDNHEASGGAISYKGTGDSLLSEISGATTQEALDAAEAKAKAAIAKFVSEKDSDGSIGLGSKLNELVATEKAQAKIAPISPLEALDAIVLEKSFPTTMDTTTSVATTTPVVGDSTHEDLPTSPHGGSHKIPK